MTYYVAEIRFNRTSKSLKREGKTRKRLTMRLAALLSALVLISALVMIVPAAGGSNHSDQSDSIISSLEQLAGNVSILTYENFSHPNKKAAEGRKGALLNKIGAVIKKIESGAFEGAVDKLTNDIRKKIEEWIDDPWELIKMVDDIIDLIRGIFPPLQPPTASFTYSPIAPLVNEVVTFNASSSTPNGGDIIRYAWDLGDNAIRFGDIVTHAYTTEGTYTVVLNVTDSEGLWDIAAAGITVYFVAVDMGPPTIVEVSQYPETPNYDEPVTVMAEVKDDEGSGIESVILCYSIDAITWTNITMSPMGNDLYSAEIPPKPYNTVVVYFIYANDTAGNSAASLPFFYRVVDLHAPVISDVEHAPTLPNYDESVTVSANVVEPPDASKVGFVILSYWDGSAWTNITMTLVGILYSVAVPMLPYGTEVQYRVYASDNAWNWAVSDLHLYQVNDDIPPSVGTPTWDPVEPSAEEEVNVSVLVSEPSGASGVKNVTLWHNATGEWQSVGCEQLANGNWTATIPGASGGVTVAFYVESYDNAGNRAATTTYDYEVKEEAAAVWPLALLAAIGLGVAALTATLLYGLYRRRKKGKASNPKNPKNPKNKPIVTLYVPAKILNLLEMKPLKRRMAEDPRRS